jgi:TP901 family phage tail tape measure protein
MGLIAQAFVEILPETSKFSAQLTRELKAQVAAARVPPVAVPVVAGAAQAGAGASAAARASGAAAASATQVSKAQREAAEATARWTKAMDLQAVTQEKLIAIENAAVGTTTKYEAARHRLTAANAAVVASEEALEAAQATGVGTTIARAEAANLDAVAKQKEALASIEALRAEEAHSRRLGQVTKGAFASAAGFLGLRGAVLAASAPFLAATAAAVAFGKAISAATSLQTSLSVFAEVSHATAEEMESVSEAAKALGADITLPAVSATDAATAMLELSKAGLSVQDSISGARGVLQLATAAQIDNQKATEIAASALNAFGLAGSEAVHVADLLANAANAAQGSIEDVGISMQQVNAVARQVGVSLEDETALLALLARNGLRGSDAGTSLRTAFLRLVNPTREANDLIRSLGLNIRDAQGNVRPEVFAEFGEATANLGPELRDAFAATIFGQDAIRAVAIAAREGTAGLEAMRQEMAQQGTAADVAAAQNVGLTGAINALKSNLETLGATLGTPVADRLAQFVTLINIAVVGVERLADAVVRLKEETEDLPGGKRFTDLLGKLFSGPEDVAKGAVSGLTFGQLKLDTEEGVRILTAGSEAAAKAARENKKLADEAIQNLSPALRSTKQDMEDWRLEAERASGTVTLLTSDMSGLADAASRANIDTTTIPEQIAAAKQTLLAQLDQLRAAQAEGATAGTLEPIQQAIDQSIAILESFGPRGAAALRAAGAQLAPFLGDALRASLGEFTGEDLSRKTGLTQAVKDLIDDLGETQAGRAELRSIGDALMDSLAEGIENNQKAVAAARKNLADVIEAGQEQIRDSIRTARGNLESIGDQLATQVANIIDKMQFRIPTFQRRRVRLGLEVDVRDAQQQLREARESGLRGDELDPFIANVKDAEATLSNFAKTGKTDIEALNKVLEELQERQERRQLRRGLRQAQEDLSDLRDSIAGVAQVAPGGSGTIARMLRDATDEVADRKAELEEFDLSQVIEGAEDIKENYKEAAEEGIQEVIDKFEEGKITAKEFEEQLNDQLAPVLKGLGKADLGIKFTRAFQRNMRVLVEQAKALAGFLGIAGTEPGPQAERPSKVVAEVAAKEAEARTRLQEAISNSRRTANATENTVTALARIELVLKQKPITKANLKQATSDIESQRLATNAGVKG